MIYKEKLFKFEKIMFHFYGTYTANGGCISLVFVRPINELAVIVTDDTSKQTDH